jgi:hypothetical protein
MIKRWLILSALALGTIARLNGGTLFYVAISASNSDQNSGITSDNGYTSAVDGGNTRADNRVVNGITLFALSGNGESSTADNCTINALSGSLSNGGGKSASIQADGVLGDALSDMTFNAGAGDNSQQEIVLDPSSLEAGTTYDLRVYICNSSGQNRQVNLSFVGDGQAAVETGWFNEDDARSSAGGFKDANQVYYIDYRYTWDGDSTPGITISQRAASAPFCLYALTNQVVPAGAGAPATDGGGGGGGGGGGSGVSGDQGDNGQGGDQGDQGGGDQGDTGLVDSDSDQVGVASDDFYSSDSLNSNGQWIDVGKWGRSWQPTNVPSGWCPYTNGNWKECDDCGWTFVSDEPWAWCTYHYGRWAKVRSGCGWAWVPGRVWAASWVSWRRGKGDSGDSCSCVGWAPLPPEAGCEFNTGISTWVDQTCDIGPDCYTFVNIRDFGSDSYSGCGCIYDRGRNTGIYIDTFNCTNISRTRWGTYCGGPDYKWCNEHIRAAGGKEISQIHVNRYDDPKKMGGGKYSNMKGNQLSLLSPHVKNQAHPQHAPKVAEHLGADKIDKGWNGKDKNLEKQARNHIAEENKGKSPKNAKATLPNDVAQNMQQHHGGGKGQAGNGQNQHPGKKGGGTQSLATGGGTGAGKGTGASGAATGGSDQHPGGKHKGTSNGGMGAGNGSGSGGGGATAGGGNASGKAFDQHPGKKNKGGTGTTATGNTGAGANQNMAGAGNAGRGGRHHPGESLKGKNGGQGSAGGGGGQTGGSGVANSGAGGGGGQQGGKHRGKGGHPAEGGGTANASAGGGTGQAGPGAGSSAGTAQGGAGQQTHGGGGGKHHKGQGNQTHSGTQGVEQGQQGAGGAGQSGQPGGGSNAGTAQGGASQQTHGGGGGKHHKGQGSQAHTETQGGPQGQQGGGAGTGAGGGGAAGAGGGGGGGGGGRHHRQQQQQQQQQQIQPQGASGGGGGGVGNPAHHHQQQQQQQQQFQPQQQQPQQQQQQQQGGKRRRGKGQPPPF